MHKYHFPYLQSACIIIQNYKIYIVVFLFTLCCNVLLVNAQKFRVIGFYTARLDLAHISFVHEANKWFSDQATQLGFRYDSTNDWNKLNAKVLSGYDVVIFLDTRPDSPQQRLAFQQYMENGGAWMGFHFAGFALTPSAYPQNWDWYHNQLMGVGEYKSNTWRPTSAILRLKQSIRQQKIADNFQICAERMV